MIELQTVEPGGIDNRFDEVIDVRAPCEFAEDRVPGAINLPVLNDAEREEVGTVYKQESPFLARRCGAAMIAANVASYLRGHFADKAPGYRPVVYCWRGGQRSQSMATILAGVGWPVVLLEGGYKAYRGFVREGLVRLTDEGAGLEFRVLAGLTGAGKTRLLRKMMAEGHQVLDLERLANHRGSLLGREYPEPQQPSQKQFENRVFEALRGMEPGRPVWVESESNRVGELHVPGGLWGRMRHAPVVELVVSSELRAKWLLEDYPHFVENPEGLIETLQRLKARVGGEKLGEWEAMIRGGAWEGFVRDILEVHYDPAYLQSRERIFARGAREIDVDAIYADGVEGLMQAVTE